MLNRINTNNLKGDVFGGLTAAVIALPMALAFGIASGAGAAAGLWGAVIIGLVASLFEGTPRRFRAHGPDGGVHLCDHQFHRHR